MATRAAPVLRSPCHQAAQGFPTGERRRHMKTLSWVVIGLILVFGAGCASSSSSPSAATTGPPANVAGSWNGGFYGSASNSVSMQLQQQGTAVTGTIQVGGMSNLDGP